MTDPGIELALLGPFGLSGLVSPFRRSAARELVVYLALHRQGVGVATWSDALWPARLMSQATLYSTVSDARRALGHGPGGRERLPRQGRRLRLDDSVTTDVERFAALASSRDPRAWSEALSLVRGTFLEGLVLTDWAIFDGTQAQVESMVVMTALKAAEHLLRKRSGAQAELMLRRALRVSPYDERLYRALLRAADAQGNRAALRSTMAELLSVAGKGATESGVDLVRRRSESIHPRTVALYRQLARGPVPATGR